MPVLRRLAAFLTILYFESSAMAVWNGATGDWIQTVLDRWSDACQKDLRLAEHPLPWMIFFDETHAWHVSPDRKLLPPHKKLPVTLRFSGRAFDVFEVTHTGAVWVPGRDPVSLEPKAVTMPYAGDTKTFFVMATPAYQHRAFKIDENEDLRNFLASVALHELAHTRQLPRVLPQIKRLQKRHRFPEQLDDNIIQTVFETNSEFKNSYQAELKQLSAAVLTSDDETARKEAAEALRMIEQRRKRFFTGEYEGWSEMEDVFLSLEGSAMWVQFQGALRMAPKEQRWLDTLAALGQRTDAWSQAQGLGLFLLIDRFSPGWQRKFFGKDVPSPIETLRLAIAASTPH